MNGPPCVLCSVPMENVVFREVTVWICPKCAGVWLNRDAVNDIHSLTHENFVDIERLQRPEVADPAEPLTGRVCPDDLSPLRRREYLFLQSVSVDGCEQCNGIWLDAGEVTKVVAVLEKCRYRPVPHSPAPVAKQEAAIAEVSHLGEMDHIKRIDALFHVLGHRFLWPGL